MGLLCSKDIETSNPNYQETVRKQRYRETKRHTFNLPEQTNESDKLKLFRKKTYKNYYFVEKFKLLRLLSIKSILNIDININSNDEIEFEEDSKIKQNLDLAIRNNVLSNERKDSLFYELLYIWTCFDDSGIENIITCKSNILFNENNQMYIGNYLKQELSNDKVNSINSFCMIIYELVNNMKYKSLIKSVMINKILFEELKLEVENYLSEKYTHEKVHYFNKHLYYTLYHPLSIEKKKAVDKWIYDYKKLDETEMTIYSIFFSDSIMEYFSTKIPSLSNLTKLNIICNIDYEKELNETAVIYLSKCFKYIPFLISLHLDLRITLFGMKIFTENLRYIPELVDLSLENNRSKQKGLIYLFQHFYDITKLEYMTLSECDNTDHNISILCNNLQFITNLKELHMECTDTSFLGFESFAKNISICKNLELLNINLLDLDKISSIKIDRIFRGYISKPDLHFNIIY